MKRNAIKELKQRSLSFNPYVSSFSTIEKYAVTKFLKDDENRLVHYDNKIAHLEKMPHNSFCTTNSYPSNFHDTIIWRDSHGLWYIMPYSKENESLLINSNFIKNSFIINAEFLTVSFDSIPLCILKELNLYCPLENESCDICKTLSPVCTSCSMAYNIWYNMAK